MMPLLILEPVAVAHCAFLDSRCLGSGPAHESARLATPRDTLRIAFQAPRSRGSSYREHLQTAGRAVDRAVWEKAYLGVAALAGVAL